MLDKVDIEANKRRNFLVNISLLYIMFTVVRPHEYIPELMDIPFMPVLMIAGILMFPFARHDRSKVIQNKLIIMFILFMFVSITLSGWLGGVEEIIKKFLPIVLLYFFIVDAFDSSEKLSKLMRLLAICAFVLALHGIQQAQNGFGWTGAGLVQGRISYIGILNDPNDLGMFFVISIPSYLYFIKNSEGKFARLIYILGILTVVYAIVLTTSRGAMLAVGAMGGVYALKKYGKLYTLIAGLVFIVGLLSMPSRVSEIDASEESAQGRVEAWYEGYQMLIYHPLTGVGPGNFTEHNYLTAHNSYVLVMAELGVIGYVIWVLFWGITLNMMLNIGSALEKKSLEEDNGDNESIYKKDFEITYALAFSILGFLIPAFFLSRSYNILLYILCAASVANYINLRIKFPNIINDDFMPSTYTNKIMAYAFASIIGLYFVVKVLLAIS